MTDKITNHWLGRHVTTVDDFSVPDLVQLLALSNHYKLSLQSKIHPSSDFQTQPNQIDSKKNFKDILKIFKIPETFGAELGSSFSKMFEDKIMACLFYEPSTRTNCSFTTAFYKLGGNVLQINSTQSSVKKGESLEDTIRCLACYADVIVMRHPVTGSVQQAADALTASKSKTILINAGDGIGEHPTQALLDLFTILDETEILANKSESLDVLQVTFVGDLKNGRTVHSLAKLLAKFFSVKTLNLKKLRLNFVAPDSLQVSRDLVALLSLFENVDYFLYASLDDLEVENENVPVISASDVLYVTRIQQERFETVEEYDAVKDSFIITKEVMHKAKNSCIVMHPLPRLNEISTEIDSDPRAAYFREMQNGLYVRMALLTLLLRDK